MLKNSMESLRSASIAAALFVTATLFGFAPAYASYTQQQVEQQAITLNYASIALAEAEGNFIEYGAYWHTESIALPTIYDHLKNGCNPVNHTTNGPTQAEYEAAEKCREEFQKEFEDRMAAGWVVSHRVV